MEINLLPWRDEVIAFNKNIFIKLMVGALAISLIITFFGYQLYFSEISYSKNYLKKLEAAKTNLVGKVTVYLGEKKVHEEVDKRINTLEKLQQSRYETIRLLNGVAKLTPKGIYLTKMERKDNQIEIAGTANSNLAIAELMKVVDASPLLDVVSLQKVEKEEGKNVVVTQFNLIITLTMEDANAGDKKLKTDTSNPATEILKMRENQKKKIESNINEAKKP